MRFVFTAILVVAPASGKAITSEPSLLASGDYEEVALQSNAHSSEATRRSHGRATGYKPIPDALRANLIETLRSMDKLGTYVAVPPVSLQSPTLSESPALPEPPATLDYRTEKSTPIKNQDVCGSCWAFAVTEVMESAFAMKFNELNVLSPQLLVSCATEDYYQWNRSGTIGDSPGEFSSIEGCTGGHPLQALIYLTGVRHMWEDASETWRNLSVSPRPMVPELLYPYVEASWPNGTGCSELGCTSTCNRDRANVISSVVQNSITKEWTWTYNELYLMSKVSANGLTFVDQIIPLNTSEYGILTNGSIAAGPDNDAQIHLDYVNLFIKQFLVNYGPVVIVINANNTALQGPDPYTGEVITTKQCGGPTGTTPKEDLDHVVVLAGYTEVDGVPAWIIRNSWDAGWGDRGYAYFAMDGNVCGFMYDMIAVTVFGDPTA